jgi:hypothetical protein
VELQQLRGFMQNLVEDNSDSETVAVRFGVADLTEKHGTFHVDPQRGVDGNGDVELHSHAAARNVGNSPRVGGGIVTEETYGSRLLGVETRFASAIHAELIGQEPGFLKKS